MTRQCLCQGLGDLEDEKGNVTEADLLNGRTLSFFSKMNSPCKEVPLAFTGHFSFDKVLI